MSETPQNAPRVRKVPVDTGPRNKAPARSGSQGGTKAGAAKPSQSGGSTGRASSRAAKPQSPPPAARGPLQYVMGGLVGVVVAGGLLGVFFLASGGKLPDFMQAPIPTPTQAPIPTMVQDVNPPTQPGQPALDPNATPASLFSIGQPGPNKGQLNAPRGIAQDANGNFFVADTQNLRIQKFDKDGKFVAAFGSKGSGDGQFNPISEEGVGTGPGGVAVDKAGNVYVADTWNHRIQKFDNDGKYLNMWGGYINFTAPEAADDPNKDGKFWGPRGVAIGPDDNLYVTDTGNKRVLVFDPDGKTLRKIDSGVSKEKADSKYAFDQPGELNEPIGIAVDGDGNVYVADTNNKRIQKFDKDGKPVAQWPVPNTNWEPGPFLEPFLALDSAGNVYAAAPSGKTVLKFDPSGSLLGQKDKEGDTVLKTPTGITLGPDGAIYVVDTSANSVLNLGKMP